MARVQVYVPDELHEQLKAHGLKASELFQAAVKAELGRLELQKAADDYLEELIAEVGEPTAEDMARAERIVRQVVDHQSTQVLRAS